MNREDIIRMAREVGFNPVSYTGANLELFERFAALVAAAEREACAKVCEGLGVHPALNVFNGGPEWYKHGKDCAAAIRART
jgi:Tat protein secretion system quality control protein TatD with DNase activity